MNGRRIAADAAATAGPNVGRSGVRGVAHRGGTVQDAEDTSPLGASLVIVATLVTPVRRPDRKTLEHHQQPIGRPRELGTIPIRRQTIDHIGLTLGKQRAELVLQPKGPPTPSIRQSRTESTPNRTTPTRAKRDPS